ncbi:CPBP family intramembrane glutamic endopeptidase [Pontibacillus litoralis]|uniref:Membrane protein n=1 Tax=Pontibacillus litoralis JSM 072002 TaxID=1385512 RepID=A0A0A5HQQ5_9BACI|nr:CPBP family intramembrane glutamic endopeptidase [Pontibacillus litoralis]KGX85947.1 membrane protein [Pontibacillus litoralis JSM 072002]
MKRRKQEELIKQLTDRQLVNQVYVTQLLLFSIAIVLAFLMIDSFNEWATIWMWDSSVILRYGVMAGLIVFLIDVVLMATLPEQWYDDGGINVRVFRSISVLEIAVIAALVAIVEELLFRGIIQTSFGYITASLAFAVLHLRYLTKPVLLLSVLMISFYLGWMFEMTQLLWVTIVAHFIIDFMLGVMIRLNIMR